jgi:hypothetical protein
MAVERVRVDPQICDCQRSHTSLRRAAPLSGGFSVKAVYLPSLLAGHSFLIPAAVGNERRKPRGRWNDQLPRESGKAEHQAGPRARFAVKAADRADDDAGTPGRCLEGDVGRAVAQICDEVHALIGQRHVQPARRAARQRLRRALRCSR